MGHLPNSHVNIIYYNHGFVSQKLSVSKLQKYIHVIDKNKIPMLQIMYELEYKQWW